MKKIEKHFKNYDCYASEKPNGNYNLGIYFTNGFCLVEKEVTEDTVGLILTDELHIKVAIDLICASGSPVDCKFINFSEKALKPKQKFDVYYNANDDVYKVFVEKEEVMSYMAVMAEYIMTIEEGDVWYDKVTYCDGSVVDVENNVELGEPKKWTEDDCEYECSYLKYSVECLYDVDGNCYPQAFLEDFIEIN